MPTSKKPRKKKRQHHGIERAKALTDFLIRPFAAWSNNQYETLTFSMLMPFAALLYEPDVRLHWAEAKGTLVLCWAMLSKSPARDTVIRANRELQAAYNLHLEGEPCKDSLTKALDLARELHHFMHNRLSPEAIQSVYNSLQGSIYDEAEGDLDSHLEEKK